MMKLLQAELYDSAKAYEIRCASVMYVFLQMMADERIHTTLMERTVVIITNYFRYQGKNQVIDKMLLED